MDIRIDELPPEGSPSFDHLIPAMLAGQATGLSVGQIWQLIAAILDPQNIGADAFDRANHTGTETIKDDDLLIVDPTDVTKAFRFDVSAIAAGQERVIGVPDRDFNLEDAFARANHTGVQAISTITGLQTALNAKLEAAAVANAIKDQNPFGNALIHVVDEKTSGTNGGSSSASGLVRTLNTVRINEISGASLASNQITLPAGEYYAEAQAPAYTTNRHRLFLIANSLTSLIAGNSAMAIAAYNAQTYATLSGRFTLAAPGYVSLSHFFETTTANVGLGIATSLGTNEVYSEIKIWRL